MVKFFLHTLKTLITTNTIKVPSSTTKFWNTDNEEDFQGIIPQKQQTRKFNLFKETTQFEKIR